MEGKINDIKTVIKVEWNKIAIGQSNLCQTYEWALANRDIGKEPLFIAVEGGNEILGGWLVFNTSLKVFPSSLTRGIIIPSEPIIIGEEKRLTILDKLWDTLSSLDPIYINWLNKANCKWKDKEFLEAKGFNEIIKYGSHVLDLQKSEVELWNNIHGKHRNVIRKAEKEGVIVEESDDIGSYFCLSEQTYKRSGKNGPSYKYLHKLYNLFNPDRMCRIYFARDGDRLVSGAFIVACGERVTYLYGATCDDPPTGSSNYLHWEIIKRIKCESYRWYDFGGVSLDEKAEDKAKGISMFKERFGGDLQVFWGGNKICSPFRKKVLDKVVQPLLTIPRYLYDQSKRRPFSN